MQVEYMSFSAHADAKGIMQLIRQAEPRNVLLVHGEAKKMEFLKQKIEQEFRTSGIPCGEGGPALLGPKVPGVVPQLHYPAGLGEVSCPEIWGESASLGWQCRPQSLARYLGASRFFSPSYHRLLSLLPFSQPFSRQ